MNDLMWAASEGQLQNVKKLINAGEDVNAANAEGDTPLHYAASNGHKDILKILLQAGAAVNAANADGETPLHDAVRYGDKDILNILLQAGAAVNATDSEGDTPLHWAAKGGHKDILKILIASGGDVNAITFNGSTVLDVAAWKVWIITFPISGNDRERLVKARETLEYLIDGDGVFLGIPVTQRVMERVARDPQSWAICQRSRARGDRSDLF